MLNALFNLLKFLKDGAGIIKPMWTDYVGQEEFSYNVAMHTVTKL